MRTAALSILLATCAALAGVANAQDAPPAPVSVAGPPAPVDHGQTQPQWDGDSWRNVAGPTRANPMQVGVSALKAGEFTLAEDLFGDYLRSKPFSADANFYMGVTRMNLGEWEEAKKNLEIAVRRKPKHPDPKSRLGVTYAELGDVTGAYAQRAELVKMSDACKGSCALSPYILGGIQMIDEALAETSTPQG